MQDEIRVAWEPLSKFTEEVFVRLGMPFEDADGNKRGDTLKYLFSAPAELLS